MRLSVRYHRPKDFVADYDQQLVRSGLLVRVEPPEGLSLFDPIELEIVPPGASAVTVSGQVVQMFPRVGVAVAFQGAPPPELGAAAASARNAADAGGPAPEHAVAPASPARSSEASSNDKIQQALHGNRDERAAILRDINKTLHAYVLRNPGLSLDEVVAMAKNATVAPDALKAIADRREWAGRPEIALALVKNPKVPVPTAIKLLDNVSAGDLRQLAKDPHTRDAVQAAAKKKVIGGK